MKNYNAKLYNIITIMQRQAYLFKQIIKQETCESCFSEEECKCQLKEFQRYLPTKFEDINNNINDTRPDQPNACM